MCTYYVSRSHARVQGQQGANITREMIIIVGGEPELNCGMHGVAQSCPQTPPSHEGEMVWSTKSNFLGQQVLQQQCNLATFKIFSENPLKKVWILEWRRINFKVVREVLHNNQLSRNLIGLPPKKFDFVYQTISRWKTRTGWAQDQLLMSFQEGGVYAHLYALCMCKSCPECDVHMLCFMQKSVTSVCVK